MNQWWRGLLKTKVAWMDREVNNLCLEFSQGKFPEKMKGVLQGQIF